MVYSRLEHDAGSMNVDVGVESRTLKAWTNTGKRGEVYDRVEACLTEQRRNGVRVSDVAPHELEGRGAQGRSEISRRGAHGTGELLRLKRHGVGSRLAR